MLLNRIYVILKKLLIVKKEFVIDSRKLNEDNFENIIKFKKEIIFLL